jgi:hypothetical protein
MHFTTTKDRASWRWVVRLAKWYLFAGLLLLGVLTCAMGFTHVEGPESVHVVAFGYSVAFIVLLSEGVIQVRSRARQGAVSTFALAAVALCGFLFLWFGLPALAST